jgi:hypothetical protein
MVTGSTGSALTIVVVIIGRTPMIVATQSLIWTGQQKRQFESHKSLRGRDGCNAQIGDRFLECRFQIRSIASAIEHGSIGRVQSCSKILRRNDRTNRNAAGGNRRQLETTRTGVFAIGDVRSGSIKRVAAAVGEGAQVMAALHRYLTDDQDAAVAISHQFGG